MYMKNKNQKLRLTMTILISVFAFIFLGLAFVLQYPSGFNYTPLGETTYEHALRYAYENNPNFGERKISEIAILGSHDSCSYDITFFSKPNPNQHEIANNFFVHTLAQGLGTRLAKAQAHDLTTQLMYGVRYFDFRITFVDDQYYTSHGYISNLLEKNLKQIINFLDKNKGEYVFIDIFYFYEGDGTYNNLAKYFETVKGDSGKSIYDFVNYDTTKHLHELTYNDLTNSGEESAVIILPKETHNSDIDNKTKLDDPQYLKYFMPNDRPQGGGGGCMRNEDNLANMKDKIEEFDKNTSPKIKKYGAQFTPSEKYIWEVATGWSLIDMSVKSNKYIFDNVDVAEAFNHFQIYQTDYATSMYENFNYKINEIIKNQNLKTSINS